MNSILKPGFLKWDGLKFVIDTAAEVVQDGGASDVIFLTGIAEVSTNLITNPEILGVRTIDDSIFSVGNLIVNIARNHGSGLVYVDLFNLISNEVLATINTVSASLVELTISLIGIKPVVGNQLILAVRGYVDPGSDLGISYAAIRV